MLFACVYVLCVCVLWCMCFVVYVYVRMYVVCVCCFNKVSQVSSKYMWYVCVCVVWMCVCVCVLSDCVNRVSQVSSKYIRKLYEKNQKKKENVGNTKAWYGFRVWVILCKNLRMQQLSNSTNIRKSKNEYYITPCPNRAPIVSSLLNKLLGKAIEDSSTSLSMKHGLE